jgi:2-keto-4-pentenoate hydratase/2-oxohepta-3-ene-1,7-dioic acid hydratase in catechol pathway
MKWCRIETSRGPSYGLVEGHEIALVHGSPFEAWSLTDERIPLEGAKWLVPVVPPVFYAIGSNYHDHVVKMAEAFGRKPVFYEAPRVGYRANNALLPHEGAIVKPKDSGDEFQYEAELVAVIGKTGRNLTREQAAECIFGYTIGNDVSERGWQAKDQTNIRAKNCDTFKPMGPWIVQGADPANMRTRVRINGELVHDFATGNMLFDAPAVIAEISRYNTLFPGDVVWLGTDDKPRNIKPGDQLEIEITGIGVLRNSVVAE